eukprot:CAMPEP_0117558942 /NCGR_PEP_ID=MMETSP0784-20121206/53104_1 /TAXON_ID=39447 /ORGANISM="" /LENGTH=419 /DNA_ID=CAMNT_0005356303 /DNA_START=209 /DNA_END=1468 /DNA_ORIENTATION=+
MLPGCPSRICGMPFRGTNLVRFSGRLLGLASRTVEVKNFVVGDLPFKRRGDFFLAIECNNNPEMRTSLAEDKHPKVVHFPEILTLRMRHSPFESKVRIVVRELNVFGSSELCELYLNAMSVFDWAGDPTVRLKRFEMKPLSSTFETETPPWILVEFDEPHEARHLDNLHGNPDIVRTIDSTTGDTMDKSILNFKDEYNLLDNTGTAIQEPFESDLQEISTYRNCVVWSFGCCHSAVFLLVLGYTVFRFYIYSCFHQFEALTIAKLQHTPFPVSTASVVSIVRKCHMAFEGTGVDDGSVACRPSLNQTLGTCAHVPYGQPRPTAFTHIVNEYFGTDIEGARCVESACDMHKEILDWDHIIVLLCIVLLLSTYVLRGILNQCIRQRKSNMQRKRANELNDMRRLKNRTHGHGVSYSELDVA